jgi:hypothetical protein
MSAPWELRRDGRAWTLKERWERWELTPEKFEMWDGKLFFDDTQRINLLGLLLENVGLDAAVRLGSLEAWEAALVAARDQPRELVPRRPEPFEEDS